MYSVAIADDETNIREGLRDLIDWHGLGFALTGVFDDGNGLVSLLQKSPPDLIVTDIRMNHCSGLDVSQYIQQHRLSTRVILISGYKEADLAMSAIKYGVKNYILKPIDLDELTDCIKRVGDELHAQYEASLQKVELHHTRSEMVGVLSLFFDELMQGTLHNQSLVRRMFGLLYPNLSFEQSACFSLALHMRSYDNFIHNRRTVPAADLFDCIGAFSASPSNNIEVRLISQRENSLLLFGLLRFQPTETVRDAIAPDIQALCDALRINSGMLAEVDHLETFTSIPAMLGSITHTEKRSLAEGLEQFGRQQKELYTVLRGGNESQMAFAVDSFVSYLECIEFASACEATRNLLYTVSAKLRENLLSPAAALTLDSAFAQLDAAAGHADLRRILMSTFLELCVALQDEQNGLVEKAKAYILEHIGEDITLEGISNSFYLSQYHFSRTFRSKTGETFIHFVTRCKMEYATQLLVETDLKIYDVCNRVGYKSVRYFTKLFKEHTGMQPSAYRQHMRIREVLQ